MYGVDRAFRIGKYKSAESGSFDRTGNTLMASPHEHVVDFLNPPVAEVGLGVQMQGATLDASRAISAFFPTVQQRYPKIVPQPPVPPIEESFEIPSQATIAFQLFGGPEAQRWAFVSEDALEMLQVQSDRFSYVWTKEESDASYPRYGTIRDNFAEAYGSYLAVAEGDVQATWCEISYTNPIMQPEGEPRPDLSTLLRRVIPQELAGLPQPYNTGLEERFQLERDGTPYARFFIQVQSTVGRPRRLGHTITLTMRGRPQSPDTEGVLAFFDAGRERIVTIFRDITTPERHAEWGLRQ
jgi:uncharacterized protein (TIGR04255 family)